MKVMIISMPMIFPKNTNGMVCGLPLICDCRDDRIAVPLHPEIVDFLNRQSYGKDLCKWRCAGSEPAAQRE